MRWCLIACLLLLGCEAATLTADPAGRDPFLPEKDPTETQSPGPGGGQAGGGQAGGGQAGGGQAERPPAAPTPELIVEAPARGARALGQSLRVTGRVANASAPVVTVNDVAAEVAPDGSFIADVPVQDGLAVLVTRLEAGAASQEDHRAVLVNADQDPATEVAQALEIGVSADGFRTLTALIGAGAGNLDLGALLGGGQGAEGLNVRSVTYDRIDLALDPDFGALKLTLAVHGLRIDVAEPIAVVATANPATITAYIELLPDGQGSLTLRVVGSEVGLADFGFDLANLGPILEALLDWPVREFAEKMLQDTLNEIIVPNLFDPSSLSQSLDLLGMQLQLGLAIDTVRIDPTGLVIGLSASAMPAVVMHPGKVVRPLPGPNGEVEDSPLDIAIAGGFVNRILHAAWAGGMLDLKIGGEDSAIELPINLTAALLLPSLGEAGRGIPPASPVEIKARGLLPPVITLVEGERPLRVEVGDFLLELVAADESLVTLAVHLTVDLAIAFDDAGALKLDFGLVSHVDVAETPRGPVNARGLETLVGGILGQLPNLIGQGLAAEDAEPMPIAPINLANPRIVAVGAFLHILADIAQGPGL
jgi:hypothetical protein